MASFAELPLKTRLFLAAYPWRRLAPVPWTAPRVSLSAAKVAVVSSAGWYRPGIDEPFHDRLGGDVSFRLLPAATATAGLVLGQRSHAIDQEALVADPESAWPGRHLSALMLEGVIGSSAPRFASFNGSITAPGRLLTETGPALAAAFRQDHVDAALFVPV